MTTGSVTVKKTRSRPAPRLVAASSSERSMALMRGRDHQKDEGEELEREDQDDALPAVDGTASSSPSLLENLREQPVSAQQDQPGLRADEGRQDQRAACPGS